MKVGAFLSDGSRPDKQETQRRQIKSLKKGAPDFSAKWFIEAGSAKRPFDERSELMDCLAYCKSTSSVFALASLSGFAERKWQALKFLEQQVAELGIDVIVADNPVVTSASVAALAGMAEHQRNELVQKSGEALQRIREQIDKHGVHVTPQGKEIHTLGAPSLEKLSEAGNAARARAADQHAEDVWPMVKSFLDRGLGYAGTARQMNRLGVSTAKGGKWYPSTIVNITKRMGGK